MKPIPIHPAADLFPMMSEEELRELADDIAEHGLIHPIVVDDQGQLIDGRNRLKACEIAKVEPRFEKLNGYHPLAYIVSANLERRNLTKGQQAMALAMIYPEPEKRGRGNKSEARKGLETEPFSKARLSQARSVLHYSRALAESVIKGAVSLDAALAQVEAAKRQAESAEGKLARIQKDAPDLAERVSDTTLALDEALTLLQDYEPDRLIRDNHGNAIEQDKAPHSYKRDESERAAKHAHEAIAWADRKRKEFEGFSSWVIEQQRNGRTKKLTFGDYVRESQLLYLFPKQGAA